MKKLALIIALCSCVFADNLVKNVANSNNKVIKQKNTPQVVDEDDDDDDEDSYPPEPSVDSGMAETIGRVLGNGLKYTVKNLDSRDIPKLCKAKIEKEIKVEPELKQYEKIAIDSCIEAAMSSDFIQKQTR